MTLCNLCSKIPWHNLPLVPPECSPGLSGHKYIHQFYDWPERHRKPNGYLHHTSLEALRTSANISKCGLCELMLKSAENVEQDLETLKPGWEAGVERKYPWPTWEFWITERKQGGPGFWVMSETDDGGVYLIAAVGLCVRDGDPLETVFSGRPIEEYAGSEIATSRAQNWLKECNEHLDCGPSEMALPSRVIDVGDYIHSPFVKLCETEGHEKGKYISSSYCWGKSREFTTTRATLEERKRQIMIADMPKTYQDAICVTRELGVRYLWIDSLCICQDDMDNWERESAKMSSIYTNAYLTISTSRARDSAEGFLNPRPPQAYVEIEYTAPGPDSVQGQALAFGLPLREEAVPTDYVSMPSEPLSDRAWGLQERVLSRRMLHYGTLQMFFECSAGFRGEDGLSLRQRYHSVPTDLKDQPEENAGEEVEKALLSSDLSSHKLNKGRAALLREWESLLSSGAYLIGRWLGRGQGMGYGTRPHDWKLGELEYMKSLSLSIWGPCL